MSRNRGHYSPHTHDRAKRLGYDSPSMGPEQREARLPGMPYDSTEIPLNHDNSVSLNKYPNYQRYPDGHREKYSYSPRFAMSPGQTPEEGDASFGGMYSQSDSKYRWRKVRGNLDLFVMERNERHLTSLQWKWQKMSRARRRTPGYDQRNTLYGNNKDGYWDRRNPYSHNDLEDYGNYVPGYNEHRHYPLQHHPSMHNSAHDQYPPPLPPRDRVPWETKEYTYGKPDYGLQEYYEEQMKLMEKRKKEEETISQLQQEQKEMESSLVTLRKRLESELQRQNDSSEVSESLNGKISKIENQITELNNRLTETDEKLKHSEAARLEMQTRITSGRSSSKYEPDELPNPPIFILADPNLGTAAAVAPGISYNALEKSRQMATPGESIYCGSNAYSSETNPPNFDQLPHPDLEEQERKEQQFKAELEKQMNMLKIQLQEQMQNNQNQAREENGKVIGERVSNLEKQIEDMNQKIQESESVIRRTLDEKKTRQERLAKERTEWHERIEKDIEFREQNEASEMEKTEQLQQAKIQNTQHTKRKLVGTCAKSMASDVVTEEAWDDNMRSTTSKSTSDANEHSIKSTPSGNRHQEFAVASRLKRSAEVKENIPLQNLSPSSRAKVSPLLRQTETKSPKSKHTLLGFKYPWSKSASTVKSSPQTNEKAPYSRQFTSATGTSSESSQVDDIGALEGSIKSVALQSSVRNKNPRVWDKMTREQTSATFESDYSDVKEDFHTIQSHSSQDRNEKSSSRKSAEEGWGEKREGSKVSLLEGLGSRYCVVPHPIWKYLGDEHDDEPMTRKKCIAFILGIILVLLLIAIVLGLIIGLATSAGDVEKSPIRYVVIPEGGNDAKSDGT